ncbi:hypothetical protein [Bacteroides acidifaciens]|uniref:hypothetical protein n=1 Tax=Bacteroides acidifaciens TaxID=85831 RepID=UPI0025B111BB|nr:hypothetical protein [Bacteroides acidifaciens]
MRKISAMYEWSGGTDYRHTCYECKNCIRQQAGKRISYICSVYQKLFGSDEKWKEYNIACKYFGKTYNGPTLVKKEKRQQASEEIAGQMSIFDFPEAMP